MITVSDTTPRLKMRQQVRLWLNYFLLHLMALQGEVLMSSDTTRKESQSMFIWLHLVQVLLRWTLAVTD